MIRIVIIALALIALIDSARAQAAPDAAGVAFFEQKIRPLLAERCYSCHSDKVKASRGGLFVDTRLGLLQGGGRGAAVVPSRPDKSLLIRAVGYQDATLKMPPDRKLNDAQIALLTEWIKRGAPDPRTPKTGAGPRIIDLAAEGKHWAFQPLRSPAIPVPRSSGWARGTVDRFVLAKLEAAGLKPNPLAEKRTLIRRVTFDLIGLPPTPAEVKAFLADTSPDAYKRVIDRLLANPHYGERWGRHWLDLARFAESHGYEQDYDRPNAYHYRDFVIKALNQDLPYDKFVRWQLAGDEIEPDNPMALLATGFLAAGTHATQITKSQVEKERYDELDDMLSTTSSTFLGLTLGCARCHDHKYDPIPTRDYYRMLSTFTKTVRSDYDINFDPEGYRQAKQAFDAAHQPLAEAVTRYEATDLPARAAEWLKSHPRDPARGAWHVLTVDSNVSSGGATFTLLPDGSLLAGGRNPDKDTYTLTTTTRLRGIAGIRIEALKDPSMTGGGPGRAANGNFALTDLKLTATPANGGKPGQVRLTKPRATFEQRGLPVAGVIDADPNSAWAVDPQFGKDHAAAFDCEEPLSNEGGLTLTFVLKFENNTGHNIGRIRLAVTTTPAQPDLAAAGAPERVAALETSGVTDLAALDPRARAEFLRWFRTQDPNWLALQTKAAAHLAAAPVPPIQKALISSEGVPAVRTHTQGGDFLEQTHFLKRGDPNQKGEPMTQGFLTVLMRNGSNAKRWHEDPPTGWRTSYQRRSFANWITDTENGAGHLLARVIVNRLWQHHFGHGIVATPSDFGTQGARPANPDLLDYLAGELIRNHWQLKPIHRLMLQSAAYCQTAAASPLQLKLDPDNKLCGRRTRLRLEAEAIRDSMLATSGLLDTAQFGPGTLDENSRRRSIYFFVKRSRLIPTLMLFDAPNALQPLPARASTVVAPQALMLINSPQVREYALALAKRLASAEPGPAPVLLSGGDPARANRAAQIQAAYQIVISREASRAELAQGLAFLDTQVAAYRAAGEAEAELLAHADLCQVLYGLNEFMYVE